MTNHSTAAHPFQWLKKRWYIAAASLFGVGWVFFYSDIYLDSGLLIPRDNALAHFPLFLYLSRYLQNLQSIPSWIYTLHGGIWLEPMANNYLFLLPYRWIGYLVAGATPLAPNSVYKVCFLLFGQGLFLFGIYWLAKLLFHSRKIAVWLLTLAGLTSLTLTNIAHEHALGTLFYLPFQWICLLKVRKNPLVWIPFFALLGLSLNNHYPQLQFGYFLALILAASFEWKAFRAFLTDVYSSLMGRRGKIVIILSLFSFLLSASPILYSYFEFRGKIESPYRGQQGTIQSTSYGEYLRMNGKRSSIVPANFKKYAHYDAPTKRMAPLDDSLLYLSPAIAFVLTLLLWIRIPFQGFHLASAFFLMVLSMGIYGPAPKLLWYVMPGIELFRQWMFFSTFLNFHLLFLIGFVFIAFLRQPISVKGKGIAFGLSGLFALLLWSQYLSPISTVVPMLLLVLKATQKSHWQTKFIGTLFVTWCLLGSFYWATGQMTEFRSSLQPNSHSRMAASAKSSRLKDPLRTLSLSYRHLVIRPVEFKTNSILKHSLANQLQWKMKDGSLLPVDPTLSWTQSILNGFRIFTHTAPEQAVGTVLLQHNDGLWKAHTKEGEPIPVKEGPMGTIELPILEGYSAISLTHSHSLWHSFIFLMWLPLLMIFFFRKSIFRSALTQETA